MTRPIFTKVYRMERTVKQYTTVCIETDGTDEDLDYEIAIDLAFDADDSDWITFEDVMGTIEITNEQEIRD